MQRSLRSIALAHGLPKAALDDLEALWSARSLVTTSVVADATIGPLTLDDPAPEDLLPADARYDDLGRIGLGAMGDVRRVRDRALDRVVAMKILHEPLLQSPGALGRFVEEARATARLEHPGIVPVHDLGQTPDGRPWFTMKEVSGITFAQHLRAPPGERALRDDVVLFLTICRTVAFAHSRGVVHRDLKPANVMVGHYGEVYVLDWGLALLAAPSGARRVVAGTPAYMAPEQALGDPIDARADVYALGAILYEILEGRPPFEGDAEQVLAALRGGVSPRPVAAFPRDGAHADELAALCARAMAREPSARPPHADALAEAVRAWLDGTQRRAAARGFVQQAASLEAEAADRRAHAEARQQEADALLRDVAAWEPEARKAPGWALVAQATEALRLAGLRDMEAEHALRTALQLAPDLTDAHAALVERHLRLHAAAEAARAPLSEASERLVLETHAAALPTTHPLHASARAYLRGNGALTLVTSPPGVEVLLHRYEPHNRRVVPVFQRSLGTTPLHAVELPMGSYLCVLRAPGFEEVRYPVEIGRLSHWDGTPPGERSPTPIWMPPTGTLAPGERYVPAGWFRAGGDPEVPEAGPRIRVWMDAFVMERDPVTNREYLCFLDDLAANGRLEEAHAHAPRERAGVVARGGSPVYGFADGRFFLQPDEEGDVWSPDWPVLLVDWHGARAFLEWRAARTGRPWRLPAGYEREKAARGVDGRWHPWGDAFDPSWCCMMDSHAGRRLPAPVGAHPLDVGPYDVRGLAGNVADWCADLFDAPRPSDGVRFAHPDVEAYATRDDLRTFRGGTWSAFARASRAAYRNRGGPATRLLYVGVRGAWSVDPARAATGGD